MTRGKQLTGTQIAEQHRETFGSSHDVTDLLWLADWRAIGAPNCTIYVIAPLDGWPCKIGVSTSPRKRLAGLQTSVWKQLQVKWCAHLPTVQQAKALERRCHETLTERSLWLHGEWFDLRPDKAIELVQFEALMAGFECAEQLERGTSEWDYVSAFFRKTSENASATLRRAEATHGYLGGR